jgi:prepilin-type N-terminal cleavage/methylation domain-containing protein
MLAETKQWMHHYRMFQQKKGFTVLELLVVIAIIGILAVVILVATNLSRTKGINAAQIKLLQQYVKALELARSGNPPVFPPTSGVDPNTAWNCFNFTNPNACMWEGGGGSELGSLNNALAPYIGDVSSPLSLTSASGNVTRGMMYRPISNQSRFEIRFALKGNVNPCPPVTGGTMVGRSADANRTLCTYRYNP